MQSGIQEHSRFILLLSKRQLSTEEINKVNSRHPIDPKQQKSICVLIHQKPGVEM